MAVTETLRAKRFFVTGGTGFLGTALIERLLRSIPESEVVLLVRPGRRASALDRAMKEVVRNDCFDRLREELGEAFDEEIAYRLSAVPGDVTSDLLGLDEEGLELLSSCDIVIHSAAAVSFDSPLDQAVEINLLGPSRVGDAMAEARSIATVAGRSGPQHLIAVSTCYVASTFQGEAKEHLLGSHRFDVDVDWRAEVDSAKRLRRDLEAESRRSPVQDELTKRARRELGSAGSHVIAIRSEKLRDEWVREQLVLAGTTGRRPSVGPTPTPTRRPWASGHSSRPTVRTRPLRFRSPSSGPRSSSPPWPSPFLAGSAASAWPSRSSSPMHEACSRSSPASLRASWT